MLPGTRSGQCRLFLMLRQRWSPSILASSTGHKGAVLELHWTTDGERIASASPDKSVRVWDAATGSQVDLWHVTWHLEA